MIMYSNSHCGNLSGRIIISFLTCNITMPYLSVMSCSASLNTDERTIENGVKQLNQ